jgi:hypothetical protein
LGDRGDKMRNEMLKHYVNKERGEIRGVGLEAMYREVYKYREFYRTGDQGHSERRTLLTLMLESIQKAYLERL